MVAGAYVGIKDLTRLRYRARGFSYLPAQPVHSVLSGRKRSRLRGRGLDFDELRHYRPGDDIRNMDWRITRRARTPYVRVYTEERDRPVWVVVDQRLSMFFGSQYQMKSVAAAEAAALAAWRVLGVGDRIGALIFGDHEQRLSLPSRSQATTMGWLKALTTMNNSLNANSEHAPNTEALTQALRALAPRLGHDGLVIIISDFDGWDDESLRALKVIRRSNDVIATVVSDPLERDIVSAHKLVVSDGRHQLEIDTDGSAAANRFRADFQQRFEMLFASLKRHAIPVVPIGTESDVTLQLQRQLGAGAGR